MPTTSTRATNQKVQVHLTATQREDLESMCRLQTVGAAKARRARILLLSDEDHLDGQRSDKYIAAAVGISERQVVRVRQQFVEEGLQATERKPYPASSRPLKLDGVAEAQLVALCCSPTPDGRARWTLQLLADELGRLKVVTSVCPETVRQCLKKTGCNRGAASASASPNRTGRDLWPRWRKSSTSTRPNTTRRIR